MFGEMKLDIDFARAVFGQPEIDAVNRVMAGHWLASGKENAAFEQELAEYVGMPYALAVNSGSSANLLALAALNLPRGSKVLTSACGFPATLSPILHLGLEPVLIDYTVGTMNIDVIHAVDEIRSGEISAVLLAHTLGVPVNLPPIVAACRDTGTLLIEDCCEAIGATFDGRQVGSFGAAGTFSFYPSHQITALGGGGMVVFRSEQHYLRAKSLRDWGKSANWDDYGRHNTTYSAEVDGVRYFPHYVYETVGWNFKLPEANCAFGREQLKRLPEFVAMREERRNWIGGHCLIPIVPEGARPSWFGVPMVVDPTAPPGTRNRIGDYLESRGVRHRPFFAGNITRHVPFAHLAPQQCFPAADRLMESAFFIGCHPGMTRIDCEYVAEVLDNAYLLTRWAA